MATALVCLSGIHAGNAIGFELTSRVAAESNFQIWVKDLNGAAEPIRITPEEGKISGATRAAISPFGDEVAYGEWGSVFIVGMNGRNRRAAYASPWYPTASEYNESVHWHPDGRSMLVTHYFGGSGNGDDVYTLDLASGVLKPLITGPGEQSAAAYSSDGKKIVYSSNTAPNGSSLNSTQLFIANADGTNAVQITTASGKAGVSRAVAPEFSPDNSEVAFEGTGGGKNGSQDIYVVQSNGLNQRQLTNDTTTDWEPEWLPSGQAIIFSYGGTPHPTYSVKPDGTERKLLVEGIGFAPKFRQPSTLIGADERLAHQLRPELMFDSEGEHWRPQNVSYFFSHDPVQVCGTTCESVDSTEDLRLYPDSSYRIDVPGSGDADNFKSSNPACISSLVWDCGSGPSSSIYYHVTDPSPQQGYRYVDYWFFYRYNDSQGSFGQDHEADWESVSLAPSSTRPETFDFASFSQHGTWYSYLRDNLSCDFGGSGTCGFEEAKYGRRLHTFIAAGTHANYGEPCGGPCTQTNSITPETDHDGGTPWEQNGNSLALVPFPATTPVGSSWSEGPAEWTDWPGLWGMDADISSPGNQGHFAAPWESSCADDDNCPTESSALRVAASSTDPECSSWFGAGVAALACSPDQLRSALQSQSLGREGRTLLSLDQGERSSASAPGLAQVMGSALGDGGALDLASGLPAGMKLYLRLKAGGQLYDATVRSPGIPAGRVGLDVNGDAGATTARLVLPGGAELPVAGVRRSFSGPRLP